MAALARGLRSRTVGSDGVLKPPGGVESGRGWEAESTLANKGGIIVIFFSCGY